jgi:hypothetical protein
MMRKVLLMMLAAAMLVASLAACNNGTASTETGTGDGEAFLGWEAIAGRKLVKVEAYFQVVGLAGKVEARLYRYSPAGGLEYLGAAVEWNIGEATYKNVTPTAETVYEAGYHYGVRIAYATATAPQFTFLHAANLIERMFELQ